MLSGESEQSGWKASKEKPLPKATWFRAFRKGLGSLWDRIGTFLLISMTWALILALPFSLDRLLPSETPLLLRYLILAVEVSLIMAVPTAGVYSTAHRFAENDEVTYGSFWRDGLRLFIPSMKLLLFQNLFHSICLLSLFFYLKVPHIGAIAGALFTGYIILLWAMMLIYQFPVLIAQENGTFDEKGRKAKRGAIAAIRRSFFLALGTPFYSLGALAVILVLTGLMVLTVALPPLLWIGMAAAMTTAFTRDLLTRYGVLTQPILEEPVPDEKFRIQ